jgi:hypothetical protein
MNKILDIVKKMFKNFPETNCYDTSDKLFDNLQKKEITIVEKFTENEKIFPKLYTLFINHLKSKHCFVYKISLKIKNNKKLMFSHSFCIVQCQNKFTMCDSWEGIHFMRCRKYATWPLFSKWLDKLHRTLYLYVNDALNLFDLFTENPFSLEEQRLKKHFKKDIEKIRKDGYYVNTWDSHKITNKDAIILDAEYFMIS